MNPMKSLEQKIKKLPPELQKEVEDFVDFLRERREQPVKGQLKLDWRGSLRDLRDQYTSVEIQHEVFRMKGGIDK
jgi:hypothetical protein